MSRSRLSIETLIKIEKNQTLGQKLCQDLSRCRFPYCREYLDNQDVVFQVETYFLKLSRSRLSIKTRSRQIETPSLLFPLLRRSEILCSDPFSKYLGWRLLLQLFVIMFYRWRFRPAAWSIRAGPSWSRPSSSFKPSSSLSQKKKWSHQCRNRPSKTIGFLRSFFTTKL